MFTVSETILVEVMFLSGTYLTGHFLADAQFSDSLLVPCQGRNVGLLRRDLARQQGTTSELKSFSSTILNAFNFDHSNLHMFKYNNRFGFSQEINHPAMEEPPFTDQVTLFETGLMPNAVMTFVYDFGDNWQFKVKLERIDPPDKNQTPTLLESRGKAPEQYSDW